MSPPENNHTIIDSNFNPKIVFLEGIDNKMFSLLQSYVFPWLMFGRTDNTQANFETNMELILKYNKIFEGDENLSRLRPDRSD